MQLILRKKNKYRLWACGAAILVSGAMLLLNHRENVRDYFVDDTLYAAEIRDAASRYGLPDQLVRAVIFRESRFDPKARGRAGEVGLMQVLPRGAVAEWARLKHCPAPNRKALEDIRINLEIGCFFLARSMNRWKKYKAQTALALCQYNAGESRAVKWAPKDPDDPDILPRITIRSTRKYVEVILRRYEQYCKEQEAL